MMCQLGEGESISTGFVENFVLTERMLRSIIFLHFAVRRPLLLAREECLFFEGMDSASLFLINCI